MKYLLCCTTIALYLHYSFIDNSLTTGNSETYYSVTKVVDGDTFWADDGLGKVVKVRLIGIDAPEVKNVFKKKKSPFGKESLKYLAGMIGGKKVRLTYDVGRFDRYGRTLAYAWLKDGTFINAKMVSDGFATVMTVPPNVKYAAYFQKLQSRARRLNLGIWKNYSI